MTRCPNCNGSGWGTEIQDGIRVGISCLRCRGRGELPQTRTELRRWLRMLKTETPTQTPRTVIVVTRRREDTG